MIKLIVRIVLLVLLSGLMFHGGILYHGIKCMKTYETGGTWYGKEFFRVNYLSCEPSK